MLFSPYIYQVAHHLILLPLHSKIDSFFSNFFTPSSFADIFANLEEIYTNRIAKKGKNIDIYQYSFLHFTLFDFFKKISKSSNAVKAAVRRQLAALILELR